MNRQIEWSPRATREYLKLIDYLLEEWGEKTAKRFSKRFFNLLHRVLERPEMYPVASKRKIVRRCVVSKHISLYYRMKGDKLQVVALFDTRQNPAKKRL